MLGSIQAGWRATVRQPFVFLTLFVYRLAWGVALYSFVESIVLPLLHRYPGARVSASQTQLFLAEGQFQLIKTDIADHYLWVLVFLLTARMLLTPLLNAGVFFSLRHTDLNAGYRFFRGMKQLAKPFILSYVLQMIFTLAPLYFLYPHATEGIWTKSSVSAMLLQLLPYLAGWLVYSRLVELIVWYLMFGLVWGRSAGHSFITMIVSFFPAVTISLLLALTALLAASVAMGVSLIWAGFWALVLYQLYRLAETLISVWGIASQHELYRKKAA